MNEKLEREWREMRSPAGCAGCLDSEFARISPHKFSHALLPQRGAADLIEVPQRGGAPPPHFHSRGFCCSVRWRRKSSTEILTGSYFCLEFVQRILGGFLAFSRNLGGFSTKPRRLLEGFLAALDCFSAFRRRILGGLSCRLVLNAISLNFGGLWRPRWS